MYFAVYKRNLQPFFMILQQQLAMPASVKAHTMLFFALCMLF